MEIHPIWRDYPELNKRLFEVEQVINNHIRIKDKDISAILTKVISSGGKRLRPAYALLCSQIGPNYDPEKSVALAAAIETLHIATLIHDDVIDQANSRRGEDTLHRLHDNKFAIYAGDYLISVCFSILSKYSSSLSQISYNTKSMEKILLGELNQLHSRFQPPKSIKNYLSIVSGKTARLFALSCYAGAVESHATKIETRHAWNMGHYIGVAFQIIDDILDFSADSNHIGKPVLADVQQGIYTLPLIYAMLDAPSKVSGILTTKPPYTDQTLEQLAQLINRTNGIEKAQNLAERYTNKALQQLDKLPNGSYKDQLYQLTIQLLKRTS